MRILKRLLIAFLLVFLLPVAGAVGVWLLEERPRNWNQARWSSSGLLPQAAGDPEAAVYIFSAMTGGMKGAIASHAWIVTKEKGAAHYNRYDKVGWGSPIRKNHRPADAFWYSNPPRLVRSLHGAEAERLIPKIEQAIAAYPYSQPGGYRIWPGPNSNTFVAHVLREVPEIGAVLPPDAVGRDYLANGGLFSIDPDGRDLHLSLGGFAGLSAGERSGLEINLLGLVAGVDILRPALKVPGVGRIGMAQDDTL
ncbi:DUF3750 domain-containing protein [Rhizobiaceae bacterium BDR2-2]|uniref:DUF3750 domain-containing protein n=1 Tax=Ectorhizobium quercum TaxID=2965071 RepID=A0AAE3SVV9_9HYPH|nr:DUF3750 domain-containing protein [Ectorhizobium quercum]MCX8998542.1 DUF3750 domain-containing protein [Ectorhizobium quercum]